MLMAAALQGPLCKRTDVLEPDAWACEDDGGEEAQPEHAWALKMSGDPRDLENGGIQQERVGDPPTAAEIQEHPSPRALSRHMLRRQAKGEEANESALSRIPSTACLPASRLPACLPVCLPACLSRRCLCLYLSPPLSPCGAFSILSL